MNQAENNMSDKQVKIYLAVLGVLLVLAVTVTVFVTYQEKQLAREEEASQQTAEVPDETKPVQQSFLDANSQIETTPEEQPEESTTNAEQLPSEKNEEQPAEPEEADSGTSVEENGVVAFNPEEDLMIWPVSGNVLMDYSPDALIYDATLDLYRTNTSISIGAAQSENVLAAAGGMVLDVGHSDELGNYVVLENGNGYATTYGQLSEEALVEVGQAVASGDVIGRISEPSWYSAALGTHLTFTVSLNGEPVNPLEVLENTLDE